jgi:hypothetical protein
MLVNAREVPWHEVEDVVDQRLQHVGMRTASIMVDSVGCTHDADMTVLGSASTTLMRYNGFYERVVLPTATRRPDYDLPPKSLLFRTPPNVRLFRHYRLGKLHQLDIIRSIRRMQSNVRVDVPKERLAASGFRKDGTDHFLALPSGLSMSGLR